MPGRPPAYSRAWVTLISIPPNRAAIELESKPNRMWDYGGNFTYADYSDRNTLYELNTYASYLYSLPPQQLKLLLTCRSLPSAQSRRTRMFCMYLQKPW